MIGLQRFFHRLRNFLRPERADREMTREVESHLQLLEDDFRRKGMDAADARLAAKRTYGGVEQAKELHRQERSWFWLEQFRQDVRESKRSLLRNPAFSLTVIATLALGIGANAAIFTLIDAVMLKALPVPHPRDLVQVSLANPDIWGMDEPYVSNPVWEQIRDRQDVFSGVFAYAIARFNLSPRGEARYIEGNYVSGQYFQTLGVQPMAGRLITSADDRRGCPATAVLSRAFWQNELGGRADVPGTTISLDGHPFEILGVIGSDFTGVDVGRKSDIYVPLCADTVLHGNGLLDDRKGAWLRIVGRPKPGITSGQVEARLKTFASSVFNATLPLNIQPDQKKAYLNRTFAVETAANGLSTIRSKYRNSLMVLMAIVAAVLLIACTNLANLLLARGAAREREIAIRMALGIGRGRLIRQQLIDSLLLALAGASLGIVLAHWAARMLVALLASNVYRENQVFLDLSVDARVLAFAIGLSLLTAALFGVVPAWRATRVDPQSAMKASHHGRTQSGTLAMSNLLVVGQVALSLVLVAAAGLLLTTFINLQTLDAGFDREHVLLIDLDLNRGRAASAGQSPIFAQLLDRIRATPGVISASYSQDTPLGGAVGANYVQIEGHPSVGSERDLVFFNEVSEDYFKTFGTRLLAGRDFNRHDTVSSPKVAIVNESFAKKYLGSNNPVGARYRAQQSGRFGDPVQIVGLVRDVKYLDLREEFHPLIYVPAKQDSNIGETVTIELRAAIHPAGLIPSAKSAIAKVAPSASVQFRTLASQVGDSLARERLLAVLSGSFGLLALLLALVGLYGLTSYGVTRRRREIGIRMALGAGRSRVLQSVFARVAMVAGIGLAIGVAGTLSITNLLAALLYGVKANDTRLLCLAVLTLALTAAFAGFIPAYRASRFDPMETLREE